MSDDSDLQKLYSQRILALATEIAHTKPIADAEAEVKKRAPLCGSSIKVALRLDEAGRIEAFSQNVKACALGQASASVLGRMVIGMTRDEVEAGRTALARMLEDGTLPPSPFEALAALAPAQAIPNRHGSILLAWDATLDAIDMARESRSSGLTATS